MALTFRPITPDDESFLRELYANTRQEELAPLDWTKDQKNAFLRMQFEAQHAYYQEHYPEASFDVVLLDGQPVGRLYIARWEKEIRLIDIALLPGFRGKGLGSSLMKDILAEARKTRRCVRIHVEKRNPALRLYRRLGFTEVADRDPYLLMEWCEGGHS